MLYTAMPLERVYHDMNKTQEDAPVELKEFETEHGRIYAEQIDGEYYIRNVVSSNMADYLDEKYKIGSIYHA